MLPSVVVALGPVSCGEYTRGQWYGAAEIAGLHALAFESNSIY